MWTHRFFKDPLQNSNTVSVPEYKVETLYSGTRVGIYILGTQSLNTAPLCAGAQALVLGHQVWTCLCYPTDGQRSKSHFSALYYPQVY